MALYIVTTEQTQVTSEPIRLRIIAAGNPAHSEAVIIVLLQHHALDTTTDLAVQQIHLDNRLLVRIAVVQLIDHQHHLVADLHHRLPLVVGRHLLLPVEVHLVLLLEAVIKLCHILNWFWLNPLFLQRVFYCPLDFIDSISYVFENTLCLKNIL
jgi:hypothetical protein